MESELGANFEDRQGAKQRPSAFPGGGNPYSQNINFGSSEYDPENAASMEHKRGEYY